MIGLEVFGETPAMTAVAARLRHLDGVQRVRIDATVGDAQSVVLATVRHDATDRVLRELRAVDVPRGDVTLTRVEEIGGGPQVSILSPSNKTAVKAILTKVLPPSFDLKQPSLSTQMVSGSCGSAKMCW